MKLLGNGGRWIVPRKTKQAGSFPNFSIPVILVSDRILTLILNRKVRGKRESKGKVTCYEIWGATTADNFGYPIMIFRESVWKRLRPDERLALQYHEGLHILLGHVGTDFWAWHKFSKKTAEEQVWANSPRHVKRTLRKLAEQLGGSGYKLQEGRIKISGVDAKIS